MLGGGLGCLKDGALKQFRKQDGLSSDFVLALYAEADGTLWIGTSDNGLCRLREGKFATISTPQGLLASIISQIADDGAGNLWMGSHHGILRVSKADLNRCANGEAKSVRCLSYGKARRTGVAEMLRRFPAGRLPNHRWTAVVSDGQGPGHH